MGKYNITRLLNSDRYRKKKRKKRITKKLEKFYWEYCTDSTGRLRKMEEIRAFQKKSKLDRKAVDIAKKIYTAPYRTDYNNGNTIKVDTFSLWENYILNFDEDENYSLEFKALLSAIRKAIADGFPIENTYLHEIPFGNSEMIIADFVNKDDYDDYHWHKKDVDIRSISFYCYYNRRYAQPVKDVDEGGSIHSYKVKTCQEAESAWRTNEHC